MRKHEFSPSKLVHISHKNKGFTEQHAGSLNLDYWGKYCEKACTSWFSKSLPLPHDPNKF